MITMKNIIKEGHKTLKQKATDVNLPVDNEDLSTLLSMMEFLINSQNPEISEKYELRPGVGLAAPQINISKRMFCIFADDENFEKRYKLALINPRIIAHSEELTYLEGGEGCLSVDREVVGLVPRYKRIRIRTHMYNYKTEEIQHVEMKLSGFLSIVFQHELDHLNGILFTDKIKKSLDDVEPLKFKSFELEGE